MKNFITNSGEGTLKGRLNELIAKSQELKFLVGFFYFSGIRELYESVKASSLANIKVLVGLNADNFVFGLQEFADLDSGQSDEEKTFKYLESVKKSLNTENFDTQEFYGQMKLLP